MHHIFEDIFGEEILYAILSGPSFAREVIDGKPTAVTLASKSEGFAVDMRTLFSTPFFRVYSHSDVIGVEVGGALKNVIAIASGICSGLGLGHNAIASLITRGLVEMAKMGKVLGAEAYTFFGLSGMGDLVLTCTGDLSRNRRVGIALGYGKGLREALSEIGGVAEGVETVRAVVRLAERFNVEMPISSEVYKVLFEGKSPQKSISDLMGREAKFEFYWLK